MPEPESAAATPAGCTTPERIPIARIVSPRSVAVAGASEDVGRFGGRVVHCLIRHGFPGRLVPTSPNRAAIRGLPACPSLTAAPGPVDVAILAVPAAQSLRQVEDCAAAGVGAAIAVDARAALRAATRGGDAA